MTREEKEGLKEQVEQHKQWPNGAPPDGSLVNQQVDGSGVVSRLNRQQVDPRPRCKLCGHLLGIVLLAAVMVTACGTDRPEPDYWIDGIGIKVDPDAAEWTRNSDFTKRILSTIEISARYGGGTIEDLRGWVIWFRAEVECEGASIPEGQSLNGCAYLNDAWIEIRAPNESQCVESTALVHEVLHSVIHDWCHNDPRWEDFQIVADEINATGPTWKPYSDKPEEPFSVVPDLWKHGPTC